MTVVSVKSGADPQVLKVGLADGSLFFVRTAYLPPALGSALRVGQGLDADGEAQLRFAGECFRTERAALALIARSEQHTAALARKLLKKEHPRASVDVVLSRLQALDLLNDSRYCELWINSRLRRAAEGPVRLVAALQAKGIPGSVARALVGRLIDRESERKLLLRYAEKCHLDLTSGMGDFGLRHRLRKAGFTAALVNDLLRNP